MKLSPQVVAGLKSPPSGRSDVIHFDDELPGFGLRIRNGGKRVGSCSIGCTASPAA